MSSATEIHSWCAETSPRGFWHHARRFPRLISVLLRNRGLTQLFVIDTLQARFQGSLLGGLWVLIHPLFLFSVYFTVFGLFFGRWEDQDTVLFALYLFSGLVCFQAITNATNKGMSAVTANGSLIKKVKFPSEILPVVPALVETAVFLVGLTLAFLIGVVTGRADVGWDLLLLPWFLVAMLAFASGVGLLLATVSVFVPDVRNIYGIFCTAWFFLSPNFWWPEFLREREPWVTDLLGLNPLYHLLIAERQILGFDAPSTGITGTAAENLLIASAWGCGVLVIGYGVFMTQRGRFSDLVQ